MRERIKELYITWFGLGYMPVASGTWGSLGGVGLALIYAFWAPSIYFYLCLASALLFCLAGAPLGSWAENKWGKKDPSQYVLDEVVGYLVAVAFIDTSNGFLTSLSLAFLLFRFFDIVKFPPSRKLERIPGGWGILLDDVVAGFYSAIVLFLINQYIL